MDEKWNALITYAIKNGFLISWSGGIAVIATEDVQEQYSLEKYGTKTKQQEVDDGEH